MESIDGKRLNKQPVFHRRNDHRYRMESTMKSRKMIISMICLASLALLATGCATTQSTPAADQAAAETSWQYTNIVDAAFVGQYATVPMAEDVMIIDARPKRAKYDKGHIPMAVSIPDSQFDKLKGNLPENKEALLIFYGKVDIYLKMMGKPRPEQWAAWID